MTTELYSDEALTNAYEVGKAEGLQQSYTESYPEGVKAGLTEGRKAGFEQGQAEGAKAYRERCRQIIESPAAKGREQAAKHLALQTDMSAEAAIAALQTMRTQSAIGARAASTFSPLDPTTLQ